ncbi:hypothetical protein UPYG_G00053230, partial [Umbra pygmaea]
LLSLLDILCEGFVFSRSRTSCRSEDGVYWTEKEAFRLNIVMKEEEDDIALTRDGNALEIKKEDYEAISLEDYIKEVKAGDIFVLQEDKDPFRVEKEDVQVKEDKLHFKEKKEEAISTVEEDVVLVKEEVIEEHVDQTVSKACAGPSPSAETAQTPDLPHQPPAELPSHWKDHLPPFQHEWIRNTLFKANLRTGKPEILSQMKLWWYPPQPPLINTQPPASPDLFFCRPIVLWMPLKMWLFPLVCV